MVSMRPKHVRWTGSVSATSQMPSTLPVGPNRAELPDAVDRTQSPSRAALRLTFGACLLAGLPSSLNPAFRQGIVRGAAGSGEETVRAATEVA